MKPASALAAALELAAQDYAVFPCGAHKRPMCPHGFHDATPDADDIKALWAAFPGELVGVVTGPVSHIAVLDIDAKHPEAREWWAANRARLLPTRTHRTRSGGLHLIFGHYDGLKCSAGKIARGVDVRAEGGYILWWPAAGLPMLSDAPIAPWPEWLIPAPAAATTRSARPRDLRPILHRAHGIVRSVALAPLGERNAVLYWAARRARDMIAVGDLDRPAGIQVVEALHEAAHRVGLPAVEITRTIRSAMRAA